MLVSKRVAALCLFLLLLHPSRTGSSEATTKSVPTHDDPLGNDDDDVHTVDSSNHFRDLTAEQHAHRVPLAEPLDDDRRSLEEDDGDDEVIAAASSLLRKNNNDSTIQPQQPQPLEDIIKEGTTITATTTTTKSKNKSIFQKACSKAIGGGIPGAIAGVIQVLSLMWLRTVINYQYRYGSSFLQAITTLYGMGGIPRLYSGLKFALIQAPLSRFISTAANEGVAVLLSDLHWGPGREVVVAASVVGFFRMMLMPIDTCKTVMQIEGSHGLSLLLDKVRNNGRVDLLYSGAVANAASAWIGHYPWFYTYNLLSKNEALVRLITWNTGRNALVGFVSSIVSDTVANFMRVIKTTKQSLGATTSGGSKGNNLAGGASYRETIGLILAVDGWRGLFGRGLKTRILGNALQSILFTVVWRGLSERWSSEKNEEGGGVGDDGDSGVVDARLSLATTDNSNHAENKEYESKG